MDKLNHEIPSTANVWGRVVVGEEWAGERIKKLEVECDTLRVENERLRDLVREAEQPVHQYMSPFEDFYGIDCETVKHWNDWLTRARAALGETKPVKTSRPVIVCLCGSTRFGQAFAEANLRETLSRHIVLSIGCNLRSDAELFADKTPGELVEIKARLDELHLRKIDLADEILVLNVNGYIGDSTRREIEYAKETGKHIRWWELRP